MRTVLAVIAGVLMTIALAAQGRNEEAAVRQTVETFYAAFNSHAWEKAVEFATDDWNHIDPFGGRTRERAGTMQD